MIYINNKSTHPYFNIALEEYVLKTLEYEGNCIILYINSPSVIIGKHQNTIEEVNQEYIEKNNIFVVRRMSGGGAVYHDLGNLNFTFIIKNMENTLYDFKRYTQPVIDALAGMGVKAEFNSRNDLTIDGRKFSGNAQHIYRNKLLHHGTLLFDSTLDIFQDVLKVSTDKIVSKGIKSVRSRVTNISEYLPEPISIGEFREALLKSFIEREKDIQEYVLTDKDIDAVNELVKNKYSTWNWNYGESPAFNFKNSSRFDGGKVEVLLDVERGGRIKNCRIYGDFLGSDDVSKVEEALRGVKYERAEVEGVLAGMDINRYFGSIDLEEVMSCMF
jgi:lipoate-protein ligase A